MPLPQRTLAPDAGSHFDLRDSGNLAREGRSGIRQWPKALSRAGFALAIDRNLGEAEGTKLLTDGLVAGKALQHTKRDGCFVTPTLANRER